MTKKSDELTAALIVAVNDLTDRIQNLARVIQDPDCDSEGSAVAFKPSGQGEGEALKAIAKAATETTERLCTFCGMGALNGDATIHGGCELKAKRAKAEPPTVAKTLAGVAVKHEAQEAESTDARHAREMAENMPTLDEVKAAAGPVIEKRGSKFLVDLLKTYGAKKVSEVLDENRREFVEDCEAAVVDTKETK